MAGVPYIPMTPKAMRLRFAEASKARDAAMAEVEPLREARDKVVAQMQPLEEQARELHQAIKAVERKNNLFAIHEEIAALSRALKGKTKLEPGDVEGDGK